MNYLRVAMLAVLGAGAAWGQSPRPATPELTVGPGVTLRQVGDDQYEILDPEKVCKVSATLQIDGPPAGRMRWYRLFNVTLGGQTIEAMHRLPPVKTLPIKTDAGHLLGVNLPPGKYLVEVGDESHRLTIGNPEPGPNPEPDDPDPVDPPDIAGKLHVLIIEETSERATLPPEQLAILTSSTVRAELNKVCAKGSDGRPAWRIFDKDQSVANEAPVWKKAMAMPRDSVPWVILSDGETAGASKPLPKNSTDMIALLRRYAK